jgi:hypothetical protein
MRKFLLVLILVLLTPMVILAAPGQVTDPAALQQLAAVRQATAKYHNVNNALADGYLATEHCIAVPGLGGMGYHYVNPNLLDGTLDPLQPELLLYVPAGNGRLKLVAVEYMVPDIGQAHPALFGQPFDGPMPGHEPGMPVHYDLHVWLWQANPNGIFTGFNPNVGC